VLGRFAETDDRRKRKCVQGNEGAQYAMRWRLDGRRKGRDKARNKNLEKKKRMGKTGSHAVPAASEEAFAAGVATVQQQHHHHHQPGCAEQCVSWLTGLVEEIPESHVQILPALLCCHKVRTPFFPPRLVDDTR
jgi:hypothetical protein